MNSYNRTYKLWVWLCGFVVDAFYITCKREELDEKIKERYKEPYDKISIAQVI